LLNRTRDFRDGSHRYNFGKSLETFLAVESQSWVLSRP
jgi:hypothetical protein